MSFTLISPAFAEGAAVAAQQPNPMYQILMLVGFVIIFYFFLMRPQQKRAKEHKQLVSSLSKGDEVSIAGGVVGRITKVTDEFISLEVAENVEINVQKQAVTAGLPKGTLKAIKGA